MIDLNLGLQVNNVLAVLWVILEQELSYFLNICGYMAAYYRRNKNDSFINIFTLKRILTDLSNFLLN